LQHNTAFVNLYKVNQKIKNPLLKKVIMNRLAIFFWSFLAGCTLTWTAHANTAVPIVSFDASGTNGAAPEASLTIGPDGNFYGTTEGNAINNGSIFKVTPDGSLTTLILFNGTNGALPLAPLTVGQDGNFYGTTEYGGNTIGNSTLNGGLGGGTVFQITTNGMLTTLVNFNKTNGLSPHGGVIWGQDGNLYGTTASGGLYGVGNVFSVTTGGTLTVLTNFVGTNGSGPIAGLTMGPDGTFYGTTQNGGAVNYGAVFRVTTNGQLTRLASFDGTNNGVGPKGGLTLGPDGNFYGTTSASYLMPFTPFPGFTILIPSGNGTIFRITTNGTLTTLIDLDNYTAGSTPTGDLVFGPTGSLYGATYFGGASAVGTIYEVTSNGTLLNLVNFNNTNGAYPLAGLTFGADNNLYGTTAGGGTAGNGTVFKLHLPPLPLALAKSGTNFTIVVDSYPNITNRIWSTTNLALPSSWQELGTVVTDNDGMGQFLDTNTTGIPAKFYQLSNP
jgi:uncharacterized repeat protein (TIGR03803 family)